MSCELQKVELQADAYMVCLHHALSTENFEVMGLLIGGVSCLSIVYFGYSFIFYSMTMTILVPILYLAC